MKEWILKYWVEWLLGIATGAIIAVVKHLNTKLKKNQAENDALKDGMRAMLRDRITQAHDYYVGKGVCPAHARENIMSMYDAYHALGGNGVVTAMKEEIDDLPTGTNNRV